MRSLVSMKAEESVNLTCDEREFTVKYYADQALGDNGKPAKGFTTGEYVVTAPDGDVKVFRHSPYKPNTWASEAKGYAASQALDHIRSWVRRHPTTQTHGDT